MRNAVPWILFAASLLVNIVFLSGALVGGASLDPDSFAALVRYWV